MNDTLIKTVSCKDLTQEQRAEVLDKLLKALSLQVGLMISFDTEHLIFREIKD